MNPILCEQGGDKAERKRGISSEEQASWKRESDEWGRREAEDEGRTGFMTKRITGGTSTFMITAPGK